MLKISVRNYRGVERSDVELEPVALVAGQNEQGKSSLAQAARAALAVVAIPIPGVLKKDAKLLVRDGADKGSAKASLDGAYGLVEWPKAEANTVGGMTWCSPFAVGLRHLLDLDDKERANILAGYINSAPGVTDLAAALDDIGYGQKAVDSLWQQVSGPGGWDGSYKKAREHTTKLKGQWEGVTGEKYGSKKAESWTPPNGRSDSLPQVQREYLEKAATQAEAALERVIGLRAVGEANIKDLNAKASGLKDLEKQEAAAGAEKSKLYDAHQALMVKGAPPILQAPMTCPKCEAPLAINGGALVEAEKPPTKAEIKKAEDARRKHVSEVDDARAAFDDAYAKHQALHGELVAARQAAAKLAEIKGKGGKTATSDDVEAARAELQSAKQALKAFDDKVQADKIHADIVRNDKLVDILSPDGLRKRKLAAGLSDLNDVLSELCAAANWPKVRIDENLHAHYGTRPVWAASASGQWRARVVIQVAMAKFDGSAAVVIDEADILDARGRNGLMAMLKYAEVRALLCMTVNKPELVPDLAKAGLGGSWWIASGIAEPINSEGEKAA